MALWNQTSGPKRGQIVLYTTGGTEYPAIIVAVNSDGTVNLAYFTPTASTANSVKQDPTGVTLTSGWRWPDEYI